MNEKELILTSVLKCRRVDLYTDRAKLSSAQQSRVRAIASRRRAKEPLQYILNISEFMGFEFFVDRRVLIPRPETELLAEAASCYIAKHRKKNLRILDIGTGSGNISVSLAKKFPQSKVCALDVSSDALTVAKMNAHKHKVAERIDFLHVDILRERDFLSDDTKFDIIISNPPYIKTDDIKKLQAEVQQEPTLALDGGEDGLRFYRRIADCLPSWLDKKGVVFFEVGQGQADEVKKLLSEVGEFVNIDCLKDYSKIDRVVIAQRK